ncbi:MAG: hypothetical protein M9894_21635 [Planctomycetes bacterium]|nr:hypothetical protein [Planctomycetota bacterium]
MRAGVASLLVGVLLGVLLGVVGGCAVAARPGEDLVVRPPTAFDVWVHDGQRARRAIVDPEAAGPEGAEVLRLVWSDPPPREGRDPGRELRWVFAGLEPPVSLRLPDGRTVAHPDPETASALAAALLVSPPDVDGVLAGLSRLHRCSTRGALLAQAAAAEGLHPTSLQALVGAVTVHRAHVALGPGPDAIPVGGEVAHALVPPLRALAARPELGPAEGKALLAASRELPRSADRAAVLLALIGAPLAPVDADDALTAAAGLEPAERRQLLLEVAARLPLTPAQAGRAIDAATTLRQEWTAEVLAALAGKADPAALRRAAGRLDEPHRTRALGGDAGG